MGRALKAGFMAGLGQGVNEGVKNLQDFYWKNRAMQHEEAQAPLKQQMYELRKKEAELEIKKLEKELADIEKRPQTDFGSEEELMGGAPLAAAPSQAPGVVPAPSPAFSDPGSAAAMEGLGAIDDKTLAYFTQQPFDPKLRQQAGIALETKRRQGVRVGGPGGQFYPETGFDAAKGLPTYDAPKRTSERRVVEKDGHKVLMNFIYDEQGKKIGEEFLGPAPKEERQPQLPTAASLALQASGGDPAKALKLLKELPPDLLTTLLAGRNLPAPTETKAPEEEEGPKEGEIAVHETATGKNGFVSEEQFRREPKRFTKGHKP